MSEAVSGAQLPSYIERPPDAAGVFAIYPGDGVPPGWEAVTWHEQTMCEPVFARTTPTRILRNVVIPTVTMFGPAAGAANGTSLILAPGGAFRWLTMDKEGYDLARWLTRLGMTAFVLRYRTARMPEDDAEMLAYLEKLDLPLQPRDEELPPRGEAHSEAARAWAEEDGRQAIRFVRQHAAEWGLDPNRIGIAGFSAGGGVAVSAAVQHDADSKPDFVAGIYLGYRDAEPVPADAPPLFLAIADDDILVGPISVARLYEAWHKAGKPAELHIFAGGAHGFGTLKQDLPSDQWLELFRNWLDTLGYLSPADERMD